MPRQRPEKQLTEMGVSGHSGRDTQAGTGCAESPAHLRALRKISPTVILGMQGEGESSKRESHVTSPTSPFQLVLLNVGSPHFYSPLAGKEGCKNPSDFSELL